MNERWEGFGERIKRLNPLWTLGKGMDLGELNEYAQMLALLVLLEVFYRELDNNQRRTRLDLVEAGHTIIQEMNLDFEVDEGQIERLIDGVLWYQDPEMQRSFKVNWFNEQSLSREEHSFRYLKEDRHYSEWSKGGKTVYQLTDESLEIIFMSREWLQELEVSIDQMYIQQQMKRGNFRKALRGLDDLLVRVKRLIQQEQEYQEDIRRNPKMIFQQGIKLRSKREAEIKKQFEEEKQRFDELIHTLQRLGTTPSEEHRQLHEKIENTRQVHDRFAQIVLQNMSLEIELRYKYPHLFWKHSNVTFRQTIWEDQIEKQGMVHPDAMSFVLQSLFSPQPPFIFPLEWVWDVQETMYEAFEDELEEEEQHEEEDAYEIRMVNWEDITALWLPIFRQLIEQGSFALSQLRHPSEEQQKAWLAQKEAIDLFLMFYGNVLTIPDLNTTEKPSDERVVLLQHLLQRDERIQQLQGKQVIVSIEPGQSMIRWKGVIITPFVIEIGTSI